MAFDDHLLLALSALVVEAVVGYPGPVFSAIGHPVTWMGAVIGHLEKSLNRSHLSFRRRRIAGVVALGLLLVPTLVAAGVIATAAAMLGPAGMILLLPLVTSSLYAQRSLHDHVAAVRDAMLSGGLAAGRRAVSMIVGRNPAFLDEAGVCRAAIESLAENFSDGVTAPAVWTVIGGLPGAAFYKAVNTSDSMIGHKTERYRAYGWAAARLDDLVNLPASRLTALVVVIAAAIGHGTSATGAIRAIRRDARKHRSPNAGWPEAAFAGALGLSLAGPRVYGETLVDDHAMGDGRREATADDIDRALRLYRHALAVLYGLFAVPLLLSLGLH